MLSKCTIVVCSCDMYEDAWNPFFKLLHIYWPNRTYPILLVNETKTFETQYCKDLVCVTPCTHKQLTWSQRLQHALQEVRTPYIILMLDDFFLNAPVQTTRIQQCIIDMQKHIEIACFSFASTLWKDINDKRFEGFERRPQDGQYLISTQAGLWRKDILQSVLRKHETPWEFEIYGTKRIARTKNVFYAANKTSQKVFSYEFGGGIHGGKWTKATQELFETHQIECDYSSRGFDPKPTKDYEKLILEDAITSVEKKTFLEFLKAGKQKSIEFLKRNKLRAVDFCKHWRSYF